MTITEKVILSRKPQEFRLYREGIFYKCYNEDAMIFSNRVREYKLSKRYVKNIGAELISLGFPISETEKPLMRLDQIGDSLGAENFSNEGKVVVYYLSDAGKGAYKDWLDVQESRLIHNTAEGVGETTLPFDSAVESMIREFDLANATPMQGLLFIQELKKLVKR